MGYSLAKCIYLKSSLSAPCLVSTMLLNVYLNKSKKTKRSNRKNKTRKKRKAVHRTYYIIIRIARESVLQLNLICENKKHLIIFVKKNIFHICERNILHSWRQTRLCTINLLFSKNNLLCFFLFVCRIISVVEIPIGR